MRPSEIFNRIARIVPGIAGYQDREALRDSDRKIRERIAESLFDRKRNLEEASRILLERKGLGSISAIGPVGGRIDRIANVVRHEPRGYGGVFDDGKPDERVLGQMAELDLAALEVAGRLEVSAAAVREAAANDADVEGALETLGRNLDELEMALGRRGERLGGPGGR